MSKDLDFKEVLEEVEGDIKYGRSLLVDTDEQDEQDEQTQVDIYRRLKKLKTIQSALERAQQENSLDKQIDKLSYFILSLDCGYPNGESGGAVDTAIQMITDYRAQQAQEVDVDGLKIDASRGFDRSVIEWREGFNAAIDHLHDKGYLQQPEKGNRDE